MGTRRWFGPKRIGWGWRPITWQGWLSTAVYLAVVIIAAGTTVRPTRYWVIGTATALFLILAFRTSRPSRRRY